MRRKLLTIDDLADFCRSHNFSYFSSTDSGYKIAVQYPSTFEIDEDNSREGLMKLKVKVAHIEKNRNKSYISEDNMKKNMPSLKNRPVLAYIHQLDNGDYDFYGHNIQIIEDEDGNEEIEYLEKQVGSYTEDDPYLEYDEEMDKTYVIGYAVIPEEYTKAAEIIRRKKGTKNSCELIIDKLQYNAENKCIELVDFYFSGSTLLGSDEEGNEIGEGMLGSRADITDFSEKNNGMFNENNKDLVATMQELTEELHSFNNKTILKEGGNEVKFEELLKKYNKTEEDITFEIEGLSDEDLEKKFDEVFGEEESEESTEETPTEDTDETDEEDESKKEDESLKGNEEVVEEIVEPFVKEFKFEISHEDVRYGLYKLLDQFDEIDNDYYFIRNVYDDYFVMQAWFSGDIYGCEYTKDNDAVALNGERYKLFEELLTETEKSELDSMRSNYSVITEELDSYKKNELNVQKEEVFADESYEQYLDTEDFKALIEHKDDYTLEELKNKAELAFAKCVKEAGSFALSGNEKKKPSSRHIFSDAKENNKKKPYGNLFD